jgi:hypothetical protein
MASPPSFSPFSIFFAPPHLLRPFAPQPQPTNMPRKRQRSEAPLPQRKRKKTLPPKAPPRASPTLEGCPNEVLERIISPVRDLLSSRVEDADLHSSSSTMTQPSCMSRNASGSSLPVSKTKTPCASCTTHSAQTSSMSGQNTRLGTQS